MTKQIWVLQGRSVNGTDGWIDLWWERRIKDLPNVDPTMARDIGAEYRVVMMSGSQLR